MLILRMLKQIYSLPISSETIGYRSVVFFTECLSTFLNVLFYNHFKILIRKQDLVFYKLVIFKQICRYFIYFLINC
mgnify:CR=1 FL=1